MKRVHFREVFKRLKELKQSGNKQVLEQFRNTKISELHYLFKQRFLIGAAMLSNIYYDLGFKAFMKYNKIDALKVTFDFIDLISNFN